MNDSLDVVVVPDFAGTRRACFEARTLFFLASWMEYGGAARAFPVHLACIGEPPRSVAWLAARCGAEIRVFAPLAIDRRGSSNKLRGLEVDVKSARVLLLDADVLVLSDFSDITRLGPALAAPLALSPRVPERHWRRIYAGLELPFPDERVMSTAGRLNPGPSPRPRYPEQNAELSSMLPYYNGGALLVPRECRLRSLWEDHVVRIAALFDPDEDAYASVAASDQAGLATAIVTLRREGLAFAELPDRFHGTWLQLYRRTLPLNEMALFHAFWLFGPAHRIDWTLRFQIERFRLGLFQRLIGEWRRDPTPSSRLQLIETCLWPAVTDARELGRRLYHLYQVHVRPALLAVE